MTINYLQTAPHKPKFLFGRNIGVAHRAGPNHTAAAFSAKGIGKQFGGILFYFNVFKSVGKLIALAPRITVNAAVRTSAVDVHATGLCRKYRFGVYKVHLLSRQADLLGAVFAMSLKFFERPVVVA